MSETLRLEIVTPYGSVFNGDADEVTAPGAEGEFGVLPGHAPFISTLKTGMLVCRQGSETLYFFVSWGYAEVGPDKVVVLADSAERSTEIDMERALEAKKRWEESLKREEHVADTAAQAALERAVTRMHIGERFGRK
jgi:F-type H+-transporting ATPase subunit epsilon